MTISNPSPFPLGEPNDGFAQYFDGQSYLASVLGSSEISIHNVTFEPGCRNHWHIHHHGSQILIAVGGRGYYQLENEVPKELKAGQAVRIPPDTKHWHGAAPSESFSHLAFMMPDGSGKPTSGLSRWIRTYTNLCADSRGAYILCSSGISFFRRFVRTMVLWNEMTGG